MSALHQHFGVSTLAGFGFDDQQPCLIAAGALLQYAREMVKAQLVHVRRLQPFQSQSILQLDDVTRRPEREIGTGPSAVSEATSSITA